MTQALIQGAKSLFTDGACKGNPGPTGLGVVILGADGSRLLELGRFAGHGTNQQAEIQAAALGLEQLEAGSVVTVHTDSMYVVATMTRGWKRKANHPHWIRLDQAVNRHRRVSWTHVRGHAGNELNEVADVLASNAARGDEVHVVARQTSAVETRQSVPQNSASPDNVIAKNYFLTSGEPKAMQIERVIRYSRADAQSAPETLFVFGDNMERRGRKGQAEALRGEPNAVGIITKNRPAYDDDAYLNDALHDEACASSWAADFDRLTKHLSAGGRVVWPADGIGTDLAQMKQRAPLLWEELCLRTRDLFKQAGQENDLIIIGAGGRDYADPVQIEIAFGHVGQRFRIAELIEGGAAGADTLCGLQADRSAIPRRTVPADWNGFAAAGNRNGAGPARNRQMADMLLARREQTGCRIGLLVLPGGRGTDNMVQTAESLGIKPMPIKQRAGHAEGIAAALSACNRGLKDMQTRGDLTKGIIEAYAEYGLPSFAGDVVKAQEAAVLTCVRVTKNPERQPKPEYLVRDVVSSFLGSLIDTRIVAAPIAAPSTNSAEAHP